MKIESKYTHILSLIAVLFFCGVLLFNNPELIKDKITIFGTVGTIVTIYGLVFAIIELIRSTNANVLAKQEASRLFLRVSNLSTAENHAECQTQIKAAIFSLESNAPIPRQCILEIIRLYSIVFNDKIKSPDSLYKQNIAQLESYNMGRNPTSSRSKRSKLTEKALYSMTGHLSDIKVTTSNFTGQI